MDREGLHIFLTPFDFPLHLRRFYKRGRVAMPTEDDDILTHEGVKDLLKLKNVNAVHYLRRKGKIPHQRGHYRCIRYSRTRVLAAWDKLERKAFTDRV